MNRLALLLILVIAPSFSAEEPRRDRFGDPLPPGAIARIGTVHAHTDVEAIAFSPDGKTVLTTSANCLRHWDVQTGRVVRVVERPAPAGSLQQVISADGSTVATLWNGRLEIRGLATNELRQQISVPTGEAISLSISPRGNLVVVSVFDFGKTERCGTVALRSDTGKSQLLTDVAPDSVVCSANGERFAGVHARNSGKVIQCRDSGGKVLFQLTAKRDWDEPITFTPDGAGLLCYHDNEFVLFHVATGTRRNAKFPKPLSHPPHATFSPDGRTVILDGGEGVTLWDPSLGKSLKEIGGYAKYFAFSPDGKRVVGGHDLMRCWDVETGKSLWPDFGPLVTAGRSDSLFWTTVADSVFTQPTGKQIGVWEAGSVRAWDWETGRVVPRAAEIYLNHETTAWLSPDGKLLYAPHDERRVIAWDSGTGKEVRRYPSPPELVSDRITAAGGSPDGRSISAIICGELAAAWVRWDAATANVVERRDIVLGSGPLARILPDGRRIADGGIVLDPVTGRGRTVAQIPPGCSLERPLSFSRDGRFATAHLRKSGENWGVGPIAVWETATGKPLLIRSTASDEFPRVALSLDNRWLAISAQESIELWDLATGQRAAELRHRVADVSHDTSRYCGGLQFLPGRKLIAAYADRTALVWNLPPETEKPPPQRIGNRTWDDLASPEPRAAMDAVWALINEPAKAVSLLRERLKPTTAVSEAELKPLLSQLAVADFARREAAVRRLQEFGHVIEKRIEAELATAKGAEQTKRLRQLLDACRDDSPHCADERRAVRVVQALEKIGTPDARALLESWTKGTDSAILTIEAKAALKR